MHDVKTLQKGTFLDTTGLFANNIEMVRYVQALYKESERAGLDLSFAIEDGRIRVHTDREAAFYHKAAQEKAVRKIYREHRRLLRVNRNALEDEDKRSYDRFVARSAIYQQSVRSAGRMKIEVKVSCPINMQMPNPFNR